MRFEYFKLLNYGGIFNGMGLHELVIDFSRCNHIITLISGKNGVGKSTLLKALNPLPDGSENLMEKLPAEKLLIISDDIGNIYRLDIIYPVTGNGNRGATKAFITKNGTELNPTGNVTSYKEMLFSEFELDSNYISLSKLSGDDRGLADKTPAERKKFVASILNSIEAYTEMYKNLSKKANIYKSYINNLSTKIRNIGEEDALQSRLVSIESQRLRLEKERDKLTAQKAEEEAFIKVTDPDGKIQEKYTGIYNKIKAINVDIEKASKTITSLQMKLTDYLKSDDLEKEHKRISKLSTDLDKTITVNNLKMTELISKNEELRNSIDIDNGKLLNLKNGFEINNLRDSVKVLENEVKSAQSILNSSQIAYQTISGTEFQTIMNTLSNIRQNIKVIYDKYSIDEISNACNLLIEGNTSNLMSLIESIEKEIETETENLKSKEVGLIQVMSKIEDAEVLNNRPTKCKIDNCPFITKALEYSKENLVEQQEYYEGHISISQGIINELRARSSMIKSCALIINDIDAITNQIANSRILLDKIPESVIFTDSIALYHRIANADLFPEVDEITKYADIINTWESFKTDSSRLKELSAELKVAESRQEAIDVLEASILSKNNDIEINKDSIETLKTSIEFDMKLKATYSLVLSDLENLIEQTISLKTLTDSKQLLVDEYHTIDISIKKIKEYIEHINHIQGELDNIQHDIDPLQNEKDNTNFALTSVQSYKSELAEYSEKYNQINILKKYSSPTSGIQTIYMDMYMGKTLTMANQLLSMLFNGEYRLLPYVINENEFRIPFVGSGMTVDDISSGSTSQICMIGMIMNLVLLFQASSKYNIVFLDEIDGGLDGMNRGLFINTLYQLINILGINQLIMISHNIESDLSNVDLIKLKGNENDSTDYHNVNIIYDYDKEV